MQPEVFDLRGLELCDPLRKVAYPPEPRWDGRLRYLHIESHSWYFDASDPVNASEAARVIDNLVDRFQVAGRHCNGYRPLHVVVDNYGGTIVGIRSDV